MGNRVLAQYTIRSKQEYIFRTNKVLEIIGASENISRAWDVLKEQAEKHGIVIEAALEEAFDMNKITNQFETGELQGAELFRGGGNDIILFDSMETYVKVNRYFSCYILKNFPGMIPMSVCVSETGNYARDYRSLMRVSEIEKNRMYPGRDQFVVPFSMMNRDTFQPFTKYVTANKTVCEYTAESESKRKKGQEISSKDPSVKIFDKMVTERGKESLLAVVHADGNNMGNKIAQLLAGKANYSECVSSMRKFTKDTAEAFITCGRNAMDRKQQELQEKYDAKKCSYRMIIADGDDVTFVCNARFVMEYVKAYLEGVQNYQKETGTEWAYSSCAGICIFHSHYPFAKAYNLAEQACDSAKQKVHNKEEILEQGWMDYHYVHSGIGGNLEQIREFQGTDVCMARPWLVSGTDKEKKDNQSFEKIEALNGYLKEYALSRNNVKKIGNYMEQSYEEARKELKRVYGRKQGLEEKIKRKFSREEEILKAFYDLAEIYDLWFEGGR